MHSSRIQDFLFSVPTSHVKFQYVRCSDDSTTYKSTPAAKSLDYSPDCDGREVAAQARVAVL